MSSFTRPVKSATPAARPKPLLAHELHARSQSQPRDSQFRAINNSGRLFKSVQYDNVTPRRQVYPNAELESEESSEVVDEGDDSGDKSGKHLSIELMSVISILTLKYRYRQFRITYLCRRKLPYDP